MNAETKFVSSVMDARLKKVRKECESFRKQRDELIEDINKLRDERDELIKSNAKFIKRNAELESENEDLRLQANTYFEQWQEEITND